MRLVGVLAGHLHVAAERQRADAVLRIAALEAEDRRVEAELELQHADADALGGQKVAELVDEHEHAEHERERQECNAPCSHSMTSDLQFYRARQLVRTLAGPRSTVADRCKRRDLGRLVRVHRALDDLREWR